MRDVTLRVKFPVHCHSSAVKIVMADIKKPRRPAWSEKAKVLAIQQYIDNKDVLLGKFKGCGVAGISSSEKENCWKRIVQSVNS